MSQFTYAEMVKHLVRLDVPLVKAEQAAAMYCEQQDGERRPRKRTSKTTVWSKAFDFAAMKFKLLCKAEGLPQPVQEYHFAKHVGRGWRFDFAWPDVDGPAGVACEVEGGIYTNGRHVRGKGYEGDMEKYSAAATMGWKVIRVAPRALCTDATITLLRAVLNPETT